MQPWGYSASKENKDFGTSAEEGAARFLRSQGYKIIQRNYRNKLGEIDIVAKDKDTICFVEVKCRRSDKFGLPCEAVSGLKQRKIARVAISFLKERQLLDAKARFDVVAMESFGGEKKINLIKNAFELSGGI